MTFYTNYFWEVSDKLVNFPGLYPWTSLISHACVPNVKIITRDDFSYICEATVPIKGPPTEIVTSYHHYYYHLFGTMYRYILSLLDLSALQLLID